MPTVVDSSGWIEYFVDGSNAGCFAKSIEKPEELIIPAISITEVYRWVLRESSESNALAIAALMKQGKVVPLDGQLAILSAEISHRHKLALADGIILTTAGQFSAKLLTQDADLEGLPGVVYFQHPKRSKK